MMLIGVDYHPSFQTIAFSVDETGEYGEQELNHSDGQAERFYRDLKQRGISVRVKDQVTTTFPQSKSTIRLARTDGGRERTRVGRDTALRQRVPVGSAF